MVPGSSHAGACLRIRLASHNHQTFAGKCINFFNKASVAQFLVQADGFDRGTRLLVTGPTTGAVEFVADEIFDDNGPVNHATKGTAVTIKVPEKVRENDKLYVLQPRG